MLLASSMWNRSITNNTKRWQTHAIYYSGSSSNYTIKHAGILLSVVFLCLALLLFLLLEGVKSPRIHFASLANFSPEFIRTVFWSLLDMKWTKYMHASVRQSITAPEIVGNDVELMQDLLSNWQHFAIVRKYGSFFLSKHYCIFIFHQQKQSFLRSREANTNSKFKYGQPDISVWPPDNCDSQYRNSNG